MCYEADVRVSWWSFKKFKKNENLKHILNQNSVTLFYKKFQKF